MQRSPSVLKAEITDLSVMISSGIPIRKICGFANTEDYYITIKGEKYFSLKSKQTSGTLVCLRQDHRLHKFFSLAWLECFSLLL